MIVRVKFFVKKIMDAINARRILPNGSLSPLAVLLYLFAVIAAVALISCTFPSNGIPFFSRTITFPSITDWTNSDDEGSGVDYFVANLSTDDFLKRLALPQKLTHSVLPAKCTPNDVRALPVQPIEFPRGKENMMLPVWQQLLVAQKNRKLMRILHYGDSQLEADRITMYLRNSLQQRFGGGGVGYVALNPVIPVNPTVKISLSNDWKHTAALVKYKEAAPLNVGVQLSSMYANRADDAWIKLERRALRTYAPLKFSQVKLLLTCSREPLLLEISTPTKLVHQTVVMPQPNRVQQVIADIGASREPLTISFSGNGSTVVHGLAMDYRSGIAVDNIPLRSSNGIDFSKANESILQQCYKFINVPLIILQVGVNMVPEPFANYQEYEDELCRQLQLLKKLAPQTAILLAGVSDIARKDPKGGISSYPNIEAIRDAQRRAAFRAKCAFWDTYEAMGGKNSIVAWAYAQPALATKDFCHFSAAGTEMMAELLYRSLMGNYEKQLKKLPAQRR
ncbi:hypothetical protein AGMMS4956_05720 [Bacteroidia bacterium]|nr:hypothetical protein AGMMS4956_05720 [Bacteroidia bacterium]